MGTFTYVGEQVCSCGSTGLHIAEHLLSCELNENDEFYTGEALWVDVKNCLMLTDEWLEWEGAGKDELYDKVLAQIDNDYKAFDMKSSLPATTGATYKFKCKHEMDPITLPGKLTVYGSSMVYARHVEGPDLGVYLATGWESDTIAFTIGCPDYSIPIMSAEKVLWIAREALKWAEEGYKVEVACQGGHGRTGLFLAILYMLRVRRPSGKSAIKWVRHNYCNEAIESKEQEWYIEGIGCELRGKPWPRKPVTATYESIEWCEVRDDLGHVCLRRAGHEDACKFYADAGSTSTVSADPPNSTSNTWTIAKREGRYTWDNVQGRIVPVKFQKPNNVSAWFIWSEDAEQIVECQPPTPNEPRFIPDINKDVDVYMQQQAKIDLQKRGNPRQPQPHYFCATCSHTTTAHQPVGKGRCLRLSCNCEEYTTRGD